MELYVNSEKHVLDGLDPGMTLLRYLRTLAKLKGTKEGCASGDCGACTVLVADEDQWLSVNSCIALVGSFAGKHIYTVDGLADSDTGELHPVQKAMVDCHGSQCGFCTPGFVMSLAGLYASKFGEEGVETEEVFDAISGNLCRCTGYRPIIDAAQTMLSYEPKVPLQKVPLSNRDAGQAAPKDSPVHYFDAKSLGFDGTPAGFGGTPVGFDGTPVGSDSTPVGSDAADSLPEYHLPTSEAQLQSLLKTDRDVFLVAGGTDKVLEISQQYQAPVKVIDVTRVDHLNKIDVTDTHIDIGAAASYSAVEDVFADYSSELIALLHRLGSRQIRNRGTLGGNIANGSPIADTPPVLFVWQAEIEAVNSQGQRRSVDINAFYKGYRDTVLATDEYIARIRIQKEEIARPHRFYKVSKRFEDDISAVMGAFVIEHQHGECTRLRAAYGGMAATPVRAHKTEQFLVGKQLDPAVAEEACIILEQEFEPLSDVRASAAYRREIAVSLFRKALSELAGIAPALPIASSATRGENYA